MAKRAAPEPPQGEPWDLPIGEAPLVFIDLEMTGLRPERDRVIEICAERVRGDRVEAAVTSLVRPESGAFGNAHIHGINQRELSEAPLFSELADAVLRLMDGGVPVAHAAHWDVSFLEAELARAGRPHTFPFYLDTLMLSRRSFALPSHSLSALCESLSVGRERAHRASDDVHALRQIWPKILDVLAPVTPRDLWHVRIGERHARPALLAAAAHAIERGLTVNVRYRPARRGPEDYQMRLTSLRTDLDPPRVLGYLLPSRSRRELRADRILAIEPVAPVPQPTSGGRREEADVVKKKTS